MNSTERITAATESYYRKPLFSYLILGALFMSVSACASTSNIDRASVNPELKQIANVVELSVEVDATLEEAWQLVAADFDKSELFVNNAKSTFYLDESIEKVGAKRRTLLGTDKFMDVEIISFDPQARYLEWEIIATNVAPLKVAFSSYKLTETIENKITITQRAGFKLKNPVMDFVGKLRFHNLFKDDLATIKYVLETRNSKHKISRKQRKRDYYPAVSVRKFY